MKIWLRDLTVVNGSADVSSDISGDVMTLELNPNHEYIIVDSDETLNPGEFVSLDRIKTILIKAQENDFSEENLAILSKSYLFEEIEEMAEKDFEGVLIINFDNETSSWNNGTGTYASDDALGRVLYDNGYNSFGCEVPEELEDVIRWEYNWTAAETDGYRVCNFNDCTYILRRF